VAKLNLPLSEGRVRLFLEGKKDWLKEGLLVLAKKKIKEEELYEKVLPQLKKEVRNKIMCHEL
jgi:hypothetical protein